jgi:large subunit ribosomal protein L10
MRQKGPRPDKVEKVGDISQYYASSTGAILTTYRGLTVAQITQLRRRLREVGGEYHVVKNTLFRRAASGEITPELDALLHGPTAIAFAQGDIVATTKVVADFLRELKNPEVVVKGGWLDGKVLSPEQVTALAKLPPREVILAQALGAVQGPLNGFAGTLNGVLGEFARTLQALADKRQADAA